MSGDPSTDPNFTGVRQPFFDHLVSKHSTAASRLDALASRLWGELSKAGLDTSPALRIREIARRIDSQARDLRQRQSLVHEMARLGLGLSAGSSLLTGAYHHISDDTSIVKIQVNGAAAADLAKKAAAGDRGALSALKKYESQADNPIFANAFLNALGSKGFVQVPAALATQARALLHRANSGPGTGSKSATEEANRFSSEASSLLTLMSSSLAAGTNPKSPAYVGDSFLKQLREQGAATYVNENGTHYFGYQAMALVWRAHGGKPPYSPRFMRVVGVDAVRFERQKMEKQWFSARPDFGGQLGRDRHPRGMDDLATKLGLGRFFDAKPIALPLGGSVPFRASVIDDLLGAARYSRQGAQALLSADLAVPGTSKPADWNVSVLKYLLTTRREVFHDHKNYAPIQMAMTAALAGKDKESTRLTNEALNLIKADVASCFKRREQDGQLAIADKEKLEGLAFLRYPLGQALADNIDKVAGVYDDGTRGFSGITKDQQDRLLLYVTRDDGAFDALLKAQTERMRAVVNSAYKHGPEKHVSNHILPEAHLFGRLLEARRSALVADSIDNAEAEKLVQQAVSSALSVTMAGPASRGFTALTNVKGVGAEAVSTGTDRLATWIASQIRSRGLSMADATNSAHRDRDLVAGAMGDMIIAAKIAYGKWSPEAINSMAGKSFATDDIPPRVKASPDKLSDTEFRDFVKWARYHSNLETVIRIAKQEMNVTANNGLG